LKSEDAFKELEIQSSRLSQLCEGKHNFVKENDILLMTKFPETRDGLDLLELIGLIIHAIDADTENCFPLSIFNNYLEDGEFSKLLAENYLSKKDALRMLPNIWSYIKEGLQITSTNRPDRNIDLHDIILTWASYVLKHSELSTSTRMDDMAIEVESLMHATAILEVSEKVTRDRTLLLESFQNIEPLLDSEEVHDS
jgi:hypothetical protein